jgi:hypothetical protein
MSGNLHANGHQTRSSRTLRPTTTHARQQTTIIKLFVHLVGAGEQKMRDYDLAELVRVKRVNFPEQFAHERSSAPSR